MTFYSITYLEAQTNLNDYVKYFFIFGSLILLVVVFSLYLRHRIQTKYRDLSIIFFLFLLFVSRVQYSDYQVNQSRHSQSSQMVNLVEQISKEKNLAKEEILVNSTQLADGIIVKIADDFYKVNLSGDQTSYTLERAYVTNPEIKIINE
ncbi:DUF3290 domain-containing protein [Enterococcus thailandicus]|uniref:DUF3290 domain-containing protein n=1 Tax=Enterococcus thailandicus TaxID=417368 RepID=UPI00289236EF|nr:DUF3290 domain-containing protein [Enterococcus thailandicus]MDT2846243.1 DUF3290 domain-containing protein [Enterococcus thailandicus]